MENKICPECSAENESEYKYCKNCGTFLPNTEEQKVPEQTFIFEKNSEEPITPPQINQNQAVGMDIGGIPYDEVSLFVGKKAHSIMPKFMKMELLGSKSSWCWPVAVLGYFFGPIGAGIWFFYRKMYKIAFLLLGIGAVLTLATTALTYNVNTETVDGLLDAFSSGDMAAMLEIAEHMEPDQSLTALIGGGIENLAGILTCILTGVFGLYAYKKHCVKTIIGFRNSVPDNRYYKIGLASLGGVSGGMVAVGIICFFFIESIASTLNIILSTIL